MDKFIFTCEKCSYHKNGKCILLSINTDENTECIIDKNKKHRR